MLGGFNNQLEQHWFLNILAQRTGRVLVEKKMKPIDTTFGSKINITELINRSKYFSNIATVPEQEYLKHCGTYSHQINLPKNRLEYDELEYMIQKINNLPSSACISIGHFPSYDFFARGEFVNWIPEFKDSILPNFEFSNLIKDQADNFVKENQIDDDNFVSVQFRRGDFEQHCKNAYAFGMNNWAFGMVYGDKFNYKQNDWDEFIKHCYPSINTLVSTITKFTQNSTSPVNKVLILTNANSTEVQELKHELKANKMEFIRFKPNYGSIPNGVTWTITHSLAVEMELARRGLYWMGNRHSTINSNLIALRLDKGLTSNTLI